MTNSHSEPSQVVTRILSEIQAGETGNTDALLRIVYHELRRLATARLKQEAPGQTLQPTALVHEAYLRLLGNTEFPKTDQHWDSRGHFFAAAAESMRRILIDNARRKATVKHGGEHQHVEFSEEVAIETAPDDQLLALNDAITELEQEDPRKAELVKLRYFAGLKEEEAAAALGISRATAARWWIFSKAWLFEKIKR